MSIEKPGQSPKFEQADVELFDEALALDKLQEFIEKILDLVEINPQYDVDSKWFNLIYGLGSVMGVEDVAIVLEQKGWDKNNFPKEILASLPEKPEVIYLLTPEQFKGLPEGTTLVDILGDEVTVGDEGLKNEKTKSGYLPFGFAEGAQPNELDLKLHKINYELAASMKQMDLNKNW
jgi:hypothetical protein